MKEQYTYNGALLEWLRENEHKFAVSTSVKYQHIFFKHIEPFFRGKTANEINQQFLDEYKHMLLKKKTCRGSLSDETLRSIFVLVKRGLSNMNLDSEVRFSIDLKKKRHDIDVFSKGEQKRLETFLKKDMKLTELGIYLCLYTGLRIGELCALKWSDIDREGEYMKVSRTVQRLKQAQKSTLVVTAPKTWSSHRLIPIADSVFPILCSFYDEKRADKYIFSKTGAVPLEPRTMQYRYRKILDESGISYRKFHTLRHTFATRCITSGMDVKTLSEILGHSNIQTTLNYYCHISIEHKKQQINLLNPFS